MSRRIFKKEKKKKRGTPLKYVRGSKNPSASEAEIMRTRRLYREGKLTPAMMDAISEVRKNSGNKKKKRKKKSKS